MTPLSSNSHRHSAAAHDLDRIDRIQTVIAGAVGAEVGIPRVTLWGAASSRFPHRFVGHAPIRGVAAWSVPETKPELAADIGHALALIHAIHPSSLLGLGLQHHPENCRAVFEEARRKVQAFPEIESIAPTECEWLNGFSTVHEYAGAPRVVHGDLVPRHIIVNESTGRLSGIIDWTPSLGDPADDFSWLFFCGSYSFVRRAIDAYELEADAGLFERAIFLARCRALDWVAGAIRTSTGPVPYLPILRRSFAVV